MKAILKNYRQSPRKVRLVADVVRGKKVTEALGHAPKFVDKRASGPFAKVIESAVANANKLVNQPDRLFIKSSS
jgi:large subunit ribosomal protein L22